MPRKRQYRHRLLLDEGVPVKTLLPRINRRHDVKHIRDDLHLAGLSDRKVYQKATQDQRIVATFNGKDFVDLVSSRGAGIIDLSSTLTPEQIDKKLLAFLSKHTPKNCLGKLYTISRET